MVLLHTDVPTAAEVDRLVGARGPARVTICLPTDPASSGAAERIAFGNLAADAVQRLRERGEERDADAVAELLEAGEDWSHLARTLVVLATPDSLTTHRLPNRFAARVHVADRFLLTPLLRALTFPQAAYVLALGHNAVRLLEVLPDGPPYEVRVPDLPRDIVDAVAAPSVRGRGHHHRLHGTEGQKVRMGQYARAVDRALRPVLSGGALPLVLAANEPLASLYRGSATYPHLAPTTLHGNAETAPDLDLAHRARAVLDEIQALRLAEIAELFAQRAGQGRAASDLADVAAAATAGRVDTVLVDMDDTATGTIDAPGALSFAASEADGYGLVDEVARRVWGTGGRVLAVRRPDVPGGGSVAALLRYAA